jgi:hypothetical protein
MADTVLSPTQVIPAGLGEALEPLPYWFVIGGHAVRCFCPYRPSRDVDFGVRRPADLEGLLALLRRTGEVEILERDRGTLHLRWRGIDVSVFVLPTVAAHVEGRRLTVAGVLATKLHAILDRGTRRDFFDLYVTLQHHRLGLAECLAAIERVYRQPVSQPLLLRALTYFDDAEREAPLPGEGASDWRLVKDFFTRRAGDLLVPPGRKLAIQAQRIDVHSERRRPRAKTRRAKRTPPKA